MTAPTARLLQLLALLQMRQEWPGPELAARLGVSARTLRRDVDKLRELDYPVEALRGRAGGYRLGRGGRLPPLQLVEDEAVAAAIGLRTAAASSVHGAGDAALRALVKLEQVMPSRLRHRVSGLATTMVHVPGAAVVDADVLMTLAGACRDHLRVRFDYVSADGAATAREAEPYQLVSWTGQWYLVAWDVDRADWRSFRVDRMHVRTPLGRRFAPREVPGGDGAAFLLEHVTRLWGEEAVIRVHAPVDSAEVQRFLPLGVIEAESATTSILRIRGEPGWVATYLSATQAEFEVLAPAALADHLLRIAARFTRAAGA